MKKVFLSTLMCFALSVTMSAKETCEEKKENATVSDSKENLIAGDCHYKFWVYDLKGNLVGEASGIVSSNTEQDCFDTVLNATLQLADKYPHLDFISSSSFSN